MSTALRPAAPVARRITRSDAIARAVSATFDRYRFLVGLTPPGATAEPAETGWLVTVTFGAALYKRVRVSAGGEAVLLPSEQAL